MLRHGADHLQVRHEGRACAAGPADVPVLPGRDAACGLPADPGPGAAAHSRADHAPGGDCGPGLQLFPDVFVRHGPAIHSGLDQFADPVLLSAGRGGLVPAVFRVPGRPGVLRLAASGPGRERVRVLRRLFPGRVAAGDRGVGGGHAGVFGEPDRVAAVFAHRGAHGVYAVRVRGGRGGICGRAGAGGGVGVYAGAGRVGGAGRDRAHGPVRAASVCRCGADRQRVCGDFLVAGAGGDGGVVRAGAGRGGVLAAGGRDGVHRGGAYAAESGAFAGVPGGAGGGRKVRRYQASMATSLCRDNPL